MHCADADLSSLMSNTIFVVTLENRYQGSTCDNSTLFFSPNTSALVKQ